MKQLEAFGIKTEFIRKDIKSYNKKEMCSGCDAVGTPLRTWRNNKKYCPRCYEEINAE